MKDGQKVFEDAYSGLNKAQKEAVDTIEGPVLVVAGPGTGKTQILTLRIANILNQTDVQPENILALTFTESGARAMRERLLKYVGAAAYRVAIHTFHGFSDMLIRSYPDAYARVVGGRPASDIEKFEIIESILESKDVKLLRPMGNPAYYVPHIIRIFGTMKQEYITPDRLSEIIGEAEKELTLMPKVHQKGAHKGKVTGAYQKKEKGILKNKELLFVYKAYEALLQERRLYDFEDMILETVDALEKNEGMLLDLQETYHYILADEHQDVNVSQNRILELIASYHKKPNLFVVGDEKQAIYRFQGASLENFLYFEEKFKETNTISLTKNYRSGQVILDASHSLISVDEGPAKELRMPLTSEIQNVSLVQECSYTHQAIEDDNVVKEISKLITEDVPKNEIVIIVRTNREVEQYAALLRKKGIAVRASADGDILTHPITHAILALIACVTEKGSEEALFAALHGRYWNIPSDDLFKILSGRTYDRSLTAILGNKEILISLHVENPEAVQRILEVIAEARKRESSESPHRVLEYLLTSSGLLSEIGTQDPLEGTRVVRRLYDEIEEMVVRDQARNLSDVVRQLRIRMNHNLPLNAPYIYADKNSVAVMTAHKSKGLEFEHVFIPHLCDSVWGGRRNVSYFDIPLTKHVHTGEFDAHDDERRLFYVALTRAKNKVYLSHSESNTEGKALIPSRLIPDIDDEFLTKKSPDQSDFDPAAALVANKQGLKIDTALVRALFEERGLSATALNNYLRSPWDYLYRNVLRIPEVQPIHMQFGTVMHGVLEQVTREHTTDGSIPNETKIKKYLESQLGRLPIVEEEFVRLHERGFEALIGYIAHMQSGLPKITKEEMKLRVVLPTGNSDFPEIMLTGMLDRLDFDEKGNVVRVVDYKTGKPKTRGYIEGTTKDSNGDYKRQLVFYALMMELYEDERYQSREGVLSFVEADAKGSIHEETYIITDAEISDLKKEIIRVALEITRGSFFNEPCDPKESNYCSFVELLI